MHRFALLVLLAACVDPDADPADKPGDDSSPDAPAITDADDDGYTADIDCDDADPAVGDAVTWYADADQDGFVDPTTTQEACEGATGWAASGPEDCDDADPAVGAPVTYYLDADGDGVGTDRYTLDACAPEEGWALTAGDCDDTDAAVLPGAPDGCDGVDNDCDGEIDEEAADRSTWYADADGDGFGGATTVEACLLPDGYTDVPGDCDDAAATTHPDAEDVCADGLDNDCSGEPDDARGCPGAVVYGEWTDLDHLVTDAEYDRVNDRIVTVSADEEALYVIDPVAGTVDAVELPLAPIAVSVDLLYGGEAVVAHDAWVSVVDLESLAVLDTLPVGTDVRDVVHGSNGYAYLFPASGQWTSIYSLDLLTGDESSSSGTIREDTIAKLHPDGDRMYGADNGLSPSDFERYDVSEGPATVVRDSPYHGDYSFSGDIWISDDGARLFARSSYVFRASNDTSTDMTYNGRLDGVGTLEWVDTCTALDRVFAVPESDSSSVYVYDLTYLSDEGTFTLPRKTGGTREHEMYGRFVFAPADGYGVHVIGEMPSSSGALLPFAFVTIDPADIP